jgi:hypothetical protein
MQYGEILSFRNQAETGFRPALGEAQLAGCRNSGDTNRAGIDVVMISSVRFDAAVEASSSCHHKVPQWDLPSGIFQIVIELPTSGCNH